MNLNSVKLCCMLLYGAIKIIRDTFLDFLYPPSPYVTFSVISVWLDIFNFFLKKIAFINL